jgi:transposase
MARKSKVPQEKIMEILAELSAGAKLDELRSRYGVSASTLYNWKSRFGNGGGKPARRGRPPKAAAKASRAKAAAPPTRVLAAGPGSTAAENARLKVMLVDLMLERDALKARLARR